MPMDDNKYSAINYHDYLDLDRLLYQIVMAAANLTHSEAASIILYDEQKNRLFFQSSTNLDSQVMRGVEIPVENSIAGEILRTQKPIIVMDTSKDSRHFSVSQDSGLDTTQSLMGVPLMAKDKIIGVLEVMLSSLSRTYSRTISFFSGSDNGRSIFPLSSLSCTETITLDFLSAPRPRFPDAPRLPK